MPVGDKEKNITEWEIAAFEKDREDFKVNETPFYGDRLFSNIVLSTNIALYKWLSEFFFTDKKTKEADYSRVVWATDDRLFRRRQDQLIARENRTGLLDTPFVGFHTQDDFITDKGDRTWWQAGMNAIGQWSDKLGRHIRQTPCTLNYQATFVCRNDLDLHYAAYLMEWYTSNESTLRPQLQTTDAKGKMEIIDNIAVVSITPHVGVQYQENDWVTMNKLQFARMDISLQTWMIGDDKGGWGIAKDFVMGFIADYLPMESRSFSIAEFEKENPGLVEPPVINEDLGNIGRDGVWLNFVSEQFMNDGTFEIPSAHAVVF
jgi:hypothetical protein